MTTTRLTLAAAALILSGCEFRGRLVEEPPPPIGEPAHYVCLRHVVALGCVRGEWRCTAPLQMRAAADGRPRCVMPGGA